VEVGRSVGVRVSVGEAVMVGVLANVISGCDDGFEVGT
jgi:hypothetical protein